MTLTTAQRQKILTPAARRIMDAIREAGGEARAVGGVVRDVIMNRAAGDIDMAVNLPPQRVMDILAEAGIKTAPTGIAHGTVTAVIDHTGYEMTTLRRDVESDGRHAQVAFTDDWRADAARRDFTFNALYVDAEGAVYDFFNGIADAQAGRVRFIGDAGARITEDVLRILRFFRFHAWFGIGEPDSDALKACRALAASIPRLSMERVAREVLKLLAARDPLPGWRLMSACGVTAHFLAEATDEARLQILLKQEKQHHVKPDALLRLAALLPQDEKTAALAAARLKLSKRDGEQLAAFVTLPALLHGRLDPVPLRRLLYKYGAEKCRAALLLLDETLDTALATIAAWDNPVFPIKGQDIVRLGIPAGPEVGKLMRAVENWWIDGDFHADRAACLQRAAQYGKIP